MGDTSLSTRDSGSIKLWAVEGNPSNELTNNPESGLDISRLDVLTFYSPLMLSEAEKAGWKSNDRSVNS
jgi:hypothetical protein